MNVFDAVKQSVTARQAAERYGIKVNRNGMACCPFHKDRHPSLKLDHRYHCFGCQADGDAIDFTAALFGLPVKDAAVKLADDFGVAYDEPAQSKSKLRSEARPRAKPKIADELKFKKAESRCFNILCDYLHLLQRWRTEYAPGAMDEEWNPLFTEALQRETYIEYLLDDVFLNGTANDKAAFISKHGKDVIQLERRIKQLVPGRTGDIDEHSRCDAEL